MQHLTACCLFSSSLVSQEAHHSSDRKLRLIPQRQRSGSSEHSQRLFDPVIFNFFLKVAVIGLIVNLSLLEQGNCVHTGQNSIRRKNYTKKINCRHIFLIVPSTLVNPGEI